MKKLKIFGLVFSLVFCCFSLTGTAKIKNKEIQITKSSKQNEKTYSVVLDYYFKNSGMKYSEFKKQINPLELENNFELFKQINKPTKENVDNVLVFYLMLNEILKDCEKNISTKNKKDLITNAALNFFILPRLIGTTVDVCGLNEKELEWLKKNITSENFKKIKITEEKLEKAKKEVKKLMEEKMKLYYNLENLKKLKEFKKLPKNSRVKVEKCIVNYKKNLEKIKSFVLNSKLEDLKKAALNFKECEVRVTNVDTSKV